MLKRSRVLLSINGQIRFADFLLARASKTIFCWFQTLLKTASKNAEKVIGADWWPFFQRRVFDILTQKLPKCRRKTAQEMPIRADLNWQATFYNWNLKLFFQNNCTKSYFSNQRKAYQPKKTRLSVLNLLCSPASSKYKQNGTWKEPSRLFEERGRWKREEVCA